MHDAQCTLGNPMVLLIGRRSGRTPGRRPHSGRHVHEPSPNAVSFGDSGPGTYLLDVLITAP